MNPQELFERMVADGYIFYIREGEPRGPFTEFPEAVVNRGLGQGTLCIGRPGAIERGDRVLGFLLYRNEWRRANVIIGNLRNREIAIAINIPQLIQNHGLPYVPRPVRNFGAAVHGVRVNRENYSELISCLQEYEERLGAFFVR